MTPDGEHTLRLVRNEKMHRSKRATLYVNDVKTEVQKRVSKHILLSVFFPNFDPTKAIFCLKKHIFNVCGNQTTVNFTAARVILLWQWLREFTKRLLPSVIGCELLPRNRGRICICRTGKKRRKPSHGQTKCFLLFAQNANFTLELQRRRYQQL